MSSRDQPQHAQPYESDDDSELSEGEVDETVAPFLSPRTIGQALEALLQREPVADSEVMWRQLLTWCQTVRLENQSLWTEVGRLRSLLQRRNEGTALAVPVPNWDGAREVVPYSVGTRFPVRPILPFQPNSRRLALRRSIHGVPCPTSYVTARLYHSAPSLNTTLRAGACEMAGNQPSTAGPTPAPLPVPQAASYAEVGVQPGTDAPPSHPEVLRDAFCPNSTLSARETQSEPSLAERAPVPAPQLFDESPRASSTPAPLNCRAVSCPEVDIQLGTGLRGKKSSYQNDLVGSAIDSLSEDETLPKSSQDDLVGSTIDSLSVNESVLEFSANGPKQVQPGPSKIKCVLSWDASRDPKLNIQEERQKLREEMMKACKHDLVSPKYSDIAEPVLEVSGNVTKLSICLDCCSVPHTVEHKDGIPVGHTCHGPPTILLCQNTLKAIELKCPKCFGKGKVEKKSERQIMKILQREQEAERRRLADEEKQLIAAIKKLEKRKASEEKKMLEMERKRAKEEKKRLEKERIEKEKREREELAVKKKREKDELKKREKREKEELAARKKREKEELAARKKREKEELKKREKREKEELAANKQEEKEELKKKKKREKEELEERKKREKEDLAARKKREKEELVAQKQKEKDQKKMEKEMRKHLLEEEKQRKKEEKNRLAKEIADAKDKEKAEKKRMKEETDERKKREKEERKASRV